MLLPKHAFCRFANLRVSHLVDTFIIVTHQPRCVNHLIDCAYGVFGKGSAWHREPFFSLVMQSYLLYAQYLRDLAGKAARIKEDLGATAKAD